jgi:DNA-binding MarR family transcriptional regulator
MGVEEDIARRDAILSRFKPKQAEGDPAKDESPLVWDDIGYLSHGLVFGPRPLLQATRSVTERYSLGPRGGWMLNLIGIGLFHPHELSDVLKIGRSLVSAELARLTEAGLVTSSIGKSDKRRSELMLTELGQAALEQIRSELFGGLTSALKGYTPDQVRLLAKMLHDLHDSAAASPD